MLRRHRGDRLHHAVCDRVLGYLHHQPSQAPIPVGNQDIGVLQHSGDDLLIACCGARPRPAGARSGR